MHPPSAFSFPTYRTLGRALTFVALGTMRMTIDSSDRSRAIRRARLLLALGLGHRTAGVRDHLGHAGRALPECSAVTEEGSDVLRSG
jgi:hypothetical protein